MNIWLLPLLLVFVSSLLSCGKLDKKTLAVEAEPSCGFVQDSYGQRVSWQGQVPAQLIVSKSWPKEYLPSAKRAVQVWNQAKAKVVVVLVEDDQLASAEPGRDFKNGLYWRTDWPAGGQYIQALTKVTFSGPNILDADIKVNAFHYEFFDKEPTQAQQIHMESLLVHEIGHMLGLKHLDARPTVMEPVLKPRVVRNELSKADLASLGCEY